MNPMQLTPDQKQAINNGEPITLLIDHTECVVMRRDIFDKVKEAIDPEETYPAVLEAWDSTGNPADGDLYK